MSQMIASLRGDTKPLALYRGGGGTSYDGLCEAAPPERGTFFWLQVFERVGKSFI